MQIKQVYFSDFSLKGMQLELPAKAGWFDGDYLKWIHSMRYKPDERKGKLTYQPELFNERSNEVLGELASGKVDALAVFNANGKNVFVNAYIESKGDNLQKVDMAEYSNNTFESYDNYLDCDSFFYPANRISKLPAFTQQTDDFYYTDLTDKDGWQGSASLDMFNALSAFCAFEYAALANRNSETELFWQTLTKRLSDGGFKLSVEMKGHNPRPQFYLKVNRRNYADLNYNEQATLDLIADFLVRLSMRKLLNLDVSAIVLIENSLALIPETLQKVFPNVQFIVN